MKTAVLIVIALLASPTLAWSEDIADGNPVQASAPFTFAVATGVMTRGDRSFLGAGIALGSRRGSLGLAISLMRWQETGASDLLHAEGGWQLTGKLDRELAHVGRLSIHAFGELGVEQWDAGLRPATGVVGAVGLAARLKITDWLTAGLEVSAERHQWLTSPEMRESSTDIKALLYLELTTRSKSRQR